MTTPARNPTFPLTPITHISACAMRGVGRTTGWAKCAAWGRRSGRCSDGSCSTRWL
jgi:hypothetical protein